MIVSPNDIIGSLVYRTREALNKNKQFIDQLAGYYYSPNCLINDKMNLWHFPGTHNEISNVLLKLGEAVNGSYLKFPAILNFHSIRQRIEGTEIEVHYNLAIVGSVKSTWTTQERESQLFRHLLRPIYEEFINQVNMYRYFNLGYGAPSHDYYEVFTTGGNSAQIKDMYGEYVDAIELHDLTIKIKPICMRDGVKILKENDLVTENVEELIKMKH